MQSIKKNYVSLNELKKQVKSVKKSDIEKVTFYLDMLLLQKRTFSNLLKLCAEFNKAHSSNDFRTKSRIISHLKFREKHNSFVYELTDNTVKLIACNESELHDIYAKNAEKLDKNEVEKTIESDIE